MASEANVGGTVDLQGNEWGRGKRRGGIGLDREGGIRVTIVEGMHKMVDTGREPLVLLFLALRHSREGLELEVGL